MSSFATLEDVISISGKTFTASEQERIETLLPLVSDALRVKAKEYHYDLDSMIEADEAYSNTVKLVVVDVVSRALRQSSNGEPMSQESQSALGYSWSGTYAIPGGGVAQAIMNNDLKALGIRKQRYGVIDFYGNDSGDTDNTNQ